MKKTIALALALVMAALSLACAKPAATADAAPAETATGDYADLMIVPGVDLAVEEYAIGFRTGSTAVAKVNEATAALLKDGSLQKIAEKYGQADVLITEPVAMDQAENAAADDDWAYIQGKGEMIIGITLFDPMNYYEGDKLIGFDTEYAEAVCANLGVTPKFVEINWDTKEVELEAKSIDCIWNGLTVTDERKANMQFTDAYIENKQVIVIKAANADKYADTASLSGANLVAEISSAGEGAIAEEANLSKATYTAVAKQTDALLEVKSGTADAAVIDYVMAKSMVGGK